MFSKILIANRGEIACRYAPCNLLVQLHLSYMATVPNIIAQAAMTITIRERPTVPAIVRSSCPPSFSFTHREINQHNQNIVRYPKRIIPPIRIPRTNPITTTHSAVRRIETLGSSL